ncbi:hypothetical protein EGH82_23000 [Vibrio ponticus]|uniref:LPP20 lipoprotein n=1 Tax=Vibrio ponticus TaxID=265668 RepID=A0A3N3DSI6_9VIBR|nr:LPP20 family lipoprotein [Vibrio ponticus]ROV57457.1 hypothetical protein EGH82_23000 [Vibrio ponticus]
MELRVFFAKSISIALLLGCQSVSEPKWYGSNQALDPDYIYAQAKGINLTSAKNSAVSQINAQLWMQVRSEYSSNESLRTINDNSDSNNYINNKINTSSAQIALSGIEYTEIDKNDINYFVQARIKRDIIVSQLESNAKKIESNAEIQLEKINHQDKFLWWLENKDAQDKLEQINMYSDIIMSLDNDKTIKINNTKVLVKEVSSIQSELLIHINRSSHDKLSADFLAQKFGKLGILNTQRNSRKITHQLKVRSEYRQSKVDNAYISTKLTNLLLINKKGKVLASNELISSANSLTSYKLSREGAERHFSAQIEELGLWSALGLN